MRSVQNPPIFKQSSRFIRCSSLSSEEESFQLFGHDRKESFRWLVFSVKIKTSVSFFAVCNNANTSNTEVSWPGVAWIKTTTEGKRIAKSP